MVDRIGSFMMKDFKKMARDIFQRKVERRQALAKLPIEKKIRILIELQKIASEIRKISGRSGPRPWQIP